jgi:twitching motility protein PilT
MHQDVLLHFQVMVKEGASDLILRTGHRPVARIDGAIQFLSEDIFTEEQEHVLLDHILTPEEAEQFYEQHEKDTAVVVPGVGRFRCNVMRQRRQTGFVFRHVQETVPSMEELYLPGDVLRRLARLRRGLVLVTGIAGSGKSTTLAAMIDHMNVNEPRHVVTVEDPIEFVFQDNLCAITQREIGIDTPDYRTALKAVVRQTPDVILVGEMRDIETVSAAISAAETGHLVLSTLHTVNAVQTVERIISFYPPHQADLIRLQLSLVLEGVVSQRLITRRSKSGRVPAVEILLGTPTAKEMVLEGRTRELATALEEGNQYYGSQSFNQSLVGLVHEGVIDYDDAMEAADSPDELKLALRGITKGVSNIEQMYGT